MHMRDISELDRKAVDYSVTIVSKVAGADLHRPTPCGEWDLTQLLTHMAAQHRGFAAAARGHGADPAVWRMDPPADPVAAYREAAADVTAAFSEAGVPQRVFALPEFGPGFTAPGGQAIGFHLIDYVVHGWDVARAIDLPYALDPELAEPALRIAEAVPDGDFRSQPGSAFAPAVPNAAPSDPLARILSLLGRSPSWPVVVK
ncbi:TIGR03086 family protein [Nocardia sp. BSTN01]|uniref:TIGR03086 family metal-binding protein n=1 Tax=Nocardia sp. BSTN01 TaxID=2783665 RepID=UPI00188EF4E7|nr:TIGR03086 family metal-binding protein [Nocardia sp. BSTN01]MBF4996392.1 TIGR03086 family protein [Nocardia sp. BSTN01]